MEVLSVIVVVVVVTFQKQERIKAISEELHIVHITGRILDYRN
jgi:hypothetical protein